MVADDTNCGDSAIQGHKLGQMNWAAHKNLFHLYKPVNSTHLYTISKLYDCKSFCCDKIFLLLYYF